MSGVPPVETFFSIRIVDIDFYLARPIPELDVVFSTFSGTAITEVPVLRIFGATPQGQKTCLHLHQVFPYFFVQYPESLPLTVESVNSYCQKLAVSIEKAVDVTLGYKGQHIFKIICVHGRPFYGYHQQDKLYLKVYNPQMMTKVVNLLRSGAIMGHKFLVSEAHIPFGLQVFIDYNLYGMSFLNLAKVKFRAPVPKRVKAFEWYQNVEYETNKENTNAYVSSNVLYKVWFEKTISKDIIVPNAKRTSSCQLEVDALPTDILNLNDLIFVNEQSLTCLDKETKLVASLAGIWNEERLRRKTGGLSSQFTQVTSQDRTVPEDLSTWQHKLKEKFAQLAEKDRVEAASFEPTAPTSNSTSDDSFVKTSPASNALLNLKETDNITPHNVDPDINETMVSQVADKEAQEILNWMKEQEEELDVQEEKEEEEDLYAHESQDILASQAEQEQAEEDLADMEEVIPQYDGANDDPISPITNQRKHFKAPHVTQTPKVKNQKARRYCNLLDPQPPTSSSKKQKKKKKEKKSKKHKSPRTKPQEVIEIEDDEAIRPAKQPKRKLFVRETPDEVVQKTGSPIEYPIILDSPPSTPELPTYVPNITPEDYEYMRTLTADSSSGSSSLFEMNAEFPYQEIVTTVDAAPIVESPGSVVPNGQQSVESPVKSQKYYPNIITYYKSPPSVAEVISELVAKGGVVKYSEPFYSNKKDVPSTPKVFAGTEFKIPHKALNTLSSFENNIKPKSTLLNNVPIPEELPSFIKVVPVEDPPSLSKIMESLKPIETPKPQTKSQGTKNLVSQIEGATEAPGFALDLESLQRDSVILNQNQHLTLISIEVHVNTRGDLRPNPLLDSVTSIIYTIRDDDAIEKSGANYKDFVGIIQIQDNLQQEPPPTGIECKLDLCKDEWNLFKKFVEIIRRFDPDIIMGYEIQQVSIGFLIDRAKNQFKIDLCSELSRCLVSPVSHFDKSKDEYGYSHASGVHIAGRIVLNIWRIMRTEVKTNIYSFEPIIYQVLQIRVPHHTFKSLTTWYMQSQKWQTYMYYIQRTKLNLQLLNALEVITRTSELARLFGIDFFSVLSRGSQYRVESMMFRLTKPQNYILLSPSKQQVAAQAAPECLPLVMEPKSRLYNSPVLVLDFQSLYPSIVIGYNYCYSTCLGRMRNYEHNFTAFGTSNLNVPKGTLANLQDKVTVAPNEVLYVKPSCRKGILPLMLQEILDTRVMVKKVMKQAKNKKSLYRALNSKQLGLKMIANVTYGYTSASFSGRMPLVELADSIVQTGRETLENAIRMVESNRAWRAKVIYGDTDSLFVLLEGATKEEAFRIGKEIADKVTEANPKPVKLQFEKVYHPCILLTKKRYVGYKYESVDQKEPIFEAKGIETVRRDSCPAVAKILEKSIRVLFNTKDISNVKEYLVRQFDKIIMGKVSIKDFIFAKEVRLGTYSERGLPPPAALVSYRAMAHDPRSEPRYGERVPYLVIFGPPNSRLADLVMSPFVFLAVPGKYQLNHTYYITKQIIPALARVFNLLGVDIQSWYAEMPRNLRSRNLLISSSANTTTGNNTIYKYYRTQYCILCNAATSKVLCKTCDSNMQTSYFIIASKLNYFEKVLEHQKEICMTCTRSRDPIIDCDAIDCPILYERKKMEAVVNNLTEYFTTIVD